MVKSPVAINDSETSRIQLVVSTRDNKGVIITVNDGAIWLNSEGIRSLICDLTWRLFEMVER